MKIKNFNLKDSTLESLKNEDTIILLNDDQQSQIDGGKKWTNHLGHDVEPSGATVDWYQDCKNNLWTGFKDKCGDAYAVRD